MNFLSYKKIITLLFLVISLNQLNATELVENIKSDEIKKYKNYLPYLIYLKGSRNSITGDGYILHIENLISDGPYDIYPAIALTNYVIKPSEDKFKEFRDTLDKINVWDWKKKYYLRTTDSTSTQLILIYPDKRINVSMVMASPDNYGLFIQALHKLVSYRKNSTKISLDVIYEKALKIRNHKMNKLKTIDQ